MTKGLMAVLAMMAMTAHGQEDLRIDWEQVDQDEAGRALDPTIVTYSVFVSRNGSNYEHVADTPDLLYVLRSQDIGCYDVYVKSFRTDALLYSVPSDIKSICVRVPGSGEEDGGSSEDGSIILPPLPPVIELLVEPIVG